MSEIVHTRHEKLSIRQLAEKQLAERTPVDFESLTQDGMRRVIHELEVHQVELETQNRQLEETQREAELSRSRYRHLYESAPIGYLTLDSDGMIVLGNLCAADLLHLPPSQLLGRALSSFIAATHQDRWHFARRALMESGERRSLELAFLLDDGSALDVGLTASGQVDSDGTINLGMLDMTELRSSERALRKAAVAVSLAEQHERRKLATDLHDDAGQLISLASIKLHVLANAVSGDWKSQFADLSELLAHARQRITSLSFQMSPPLLHDVGLLAATRWLAEDLAQNYQLAVTVAESPEIALDEVTRITFFQAIRELLINVKKHAGVDKARVQVWREGVMVRASVEDRGVGFASDVGRSSFGPPDGRVGFGLLALRERLGQLGGTLDVGSGIDGSGSRIVVSLPLTEIEGDLR